MSRSNNHSDFDQDPEKIKNRLIELEEAVQVHQQILNDLGEILKARELQITRLEKSVQAKEIALTVFQQALNASQQTLKEIVNSRSWKLLRRIFQRVDKICPPDSKRRKALRKFISLFIR